MKTRINKDLGRRFLSLMLALVMCVSLLNITALAADEGEGEVVDEPSIQTVDGEGEVDPENKDESEPEKEAAPEVNTEDDAKDEGEEEDGENPAAGTIIDGKVADGKGGFLTFGGFLGGSGASQKDEGDEADEAETKPEGEGSDVDTMLPEIGGEPVEDETAGDETAEDETEIMPIATTVAKVDDKDFLTIDEAVAYANGHPASTVILQVPEVTAASEIEITAPMTLNLNGKALTGNIIVAEGGDLNLKIGGGDSQKMNGAITVKTGGNLTLEDNSSSSNGFRYPYKVTLYESTCVSMATRPSNNRAPYINLTIEENVWEKYSKAGLHDILPPWVLVKNIGGNITITNMSKASMQTDNVESAVLSKVYDSTAHTVSLVKENSTDVPDVPGVFLSGNGTADADGKYASPVSSFETAKALLETSEEKTIYVTDTVKVTKDETWSLAGIEGAKITRFPGIAEDHSDAFTGDLVEVTKDGSLTLDHITLDGGSLVDVPDDDKVEIPSLVIRGALVKVEGGKLTLNEGTVLRNNVKNGRKGDEWNDAVVGAAIFAEHGAEVVMNEGLITENTAGNGGGIALYHDSTFTMNGGEISRNKASEFAANRGKSRPTKTSEWTTGDWIRVGGGGVFLAYGSTFDLNGGTIQQNNSDYYGGGIAVGGFNSAVVKAENAGGKIPTLNMNGGKVAWNTSKNVGGGIFVETGCEATIREGDIIGNTSRGGLFGGGGVYVNGGDMTGVPNGHLQLYNVEIAGNTAVKSGAAIAGCPTSNVRVYLTEGTVIHDNYSDFNQTPSKSDVFISAVTAEAHSGNPEVVVSDFMLGGGRYHWMNQDKEPYEVNDNGQLKLGYAYESILKTDATREDFDVTAGVALAKVHIKSNSATNYGGGIGANGDVTIGVKEETGLWLEKRLDGEGARNHTDDTFSFTVQFEDFNGKVRVTKENQKYEDMILADGSYTVELKAGEGVFLSGIPTGTKYTVTETNTSDADGTRVKYSTTVLGTETIEQHTAVDKENTQTATRTNYGSTTVEGTVASGEILPKGFATVVIFTNTFDAGELEVTKTVTGETGDTSKEWNFTVTLSDTTVNGKFGEMEFTNGVATFTLKHGETKTAKQLPYGITYTVTEAEANQGGYTTSATGASDTIEKNQTKTAGFVNTSDPDNPPPPPGPSTSYTSLSVEKIWADEGHEEERPSSVQVQLYRDGVPFGGTVTLSEANGWRHEWTDLNDRYDWTIGEVNVPEAYTATVSGSGTSYTITNTYDEPDNPPPPDEDIPDDPPPLSDIPDEDLPLVELPDEELPLEEIPEEEVPLDDVPQTGDSSRKTLWMALMACSGLGMALLGIQSKKREDEEQ